jgi:ribose 5-phosphate isomerase B
MIRQQGSHQGKPVVFGWDRHLLGEVETYAAELSSFGPLLAIASSDGAPHYIAASEWVSRRVQGSRRVGVLVCANGLGVSIAANKFRGIYAARCLTIEDAELARVVNNANVLCLSARATYEVNRRIIRTFMTVAYEGRRLEQLERIGLLELEQAATAARVTDRTPWWRRRVG